jgi:hypothetical protein
MERHQGPADRWPLDAADAVELVARITREMDEGGNERSDVLLADLVCAAWPSGTAQNQ